MDPEWNLENVLDQLFSVAKRRAAVGVGRDVAGHDEERIVPEVGLLERIDQLTERAILARERPVVDGPHAGAIVLGQSEARVLSSRASDHFRCAPRFHRPGVFRGWQLGRVVHRHVPGRMPASRVHHDQRAPSSALHVLERPLRSLAQRGNGRRTFDRRDGEVFVPAAREAKCFEGGGTSGKHRGLHASIAGRDSERGQRAERRAPASSTPCARGESPVSNVAMTPAVTVVGPRCDSKVVAVRASSDSVGQISWLATFERSSPESTTTITSLAGGTEGGGLVAT